MLLSRLPLISAVLLFALLVVSIYLQTFKLFEPEAMPTNKPNTQTFISQTRPSKKKTHNIAKFNLFGNSALKPQKAVEVQKDLPKTKLKLTLTGVLVSPTNTGGGALIFGPDKETQHYKVNDELPGGATLQQVFADRVIVNRSGRLENLYFTENHNSGIVRYSPKQEPEKQAASSTSQNKRYSKQARELSSARSQSIKNRLSKLKKRIIKHN